MRDRLAPTDVRQLGVESARRLDRSFGVRARKLKAPKGAPHPAAQSRGVQGCACASLPA